MYSVDDLCVWKFMTGDKESTTFEIVIESIKEGYPHPLKPCLECSGYNNDCKGYKMNRVERCEEK